MRRRGEELNRVVPIAKTLVSWKEIASYLGVTPRTAQEWEKERGLPVHREGNPQKPTVTAYPSELDLWRREGRLSGNGGVVHQRPTKSSRKRLLLLLFLLALVAMVFWGTRPDPRLPAVCRVEGTLLQVFDPRGDLLWAVDTPDLDAIWYQGDPRDPYQVVDLDGDGRPEILFNASLYESSTPFGKLICYDSAGKVRWEYRYGRVKKWGDRVFSNHYRGRLVRVVPSGGRNYILISAVHHTWFPCQVSLLDGITGELVSEYWHPGWLSSYNAFDLDGDGNVEVLLGGINNPGVDCLGRAAMVALKVPFSSPQDGMEEEWISKFGGGEFRYCVFPGADVFQVRNQGSMAEYIQTYTEDSMTVVVGNEMDGRLHYHVDKQFRPTGVVPCDGFVRAHKQFQREGRLDHDLTPEEIAGLQKTYLYETAPPCHQDP
jgi:hypothetical protein